MSARAFSAPRARLSAVVSGRGREAGPLEAHERNVLAITKRIHGKEQRVRALLAQVKRLRQELRFDRREFRAVLQRDPAPSLDRLELAGRADAVDAVEAAQERRRR